MKRGIFDERYFQLDCVFTSLTGNFDSFRDHGTAVLVEGSEFALRIVRDIRNN